jgi:hypothetical protein
MTLQKREEDEPSIIRSWARMDRRNRVLEVLPPVGLFLLLVGTLVAAGFLMVHHHDIIGLIVVIAGSTLCLFLTCLLRIPMMSISHSDLMPIRTERSDAGLSQCELVIDIRQEFC